MINKETKTARGELNSQGLAALCRSMLLQAATDITYGSPGEKKHDEAEHFLQSDFAELAADYVGFDAELLRLAAEDPDASDRIITARQRKRKQ